MILLGHNGAGKSTLIYYLLGFTPGLSHHPFLAHFSEICKPLSLESIGYAPESATLDGNLTAYDYLALMAVLKEVESYEPKCLLESVTLQVDPTRPISKFSKGMKQKLLLAIALLGNPETIVLDEPTSGLDPFVQHEIETLLLNLKQNHDLIVSTHNLSFAMALDQEIWILKQGRIVYRGRPKSESELKELMLSHRPEGNV